MDINYNCRKAMGLVIIFLLLLLRCTGQTITIKGIVVAGLEKTTLSDAVIKIAAIDSSCIKSTRSNSKGIFYFKEVPKNIYTLSITHISFSHFQRQLKLFDSVFNDLGVLILLPKETFLPEVIIKRETVHPHLKGDTLEYITSATRLKPNASVEELLKMMPGIVVDQNGNIFVNGHKIQHLLINGQDIFGGSLSSVIRTFNADMIAKVQVLDKKSKVSEFTGIYDGQSSKTLNLVLRSDNTKGDFEKGEAGIGPQGYYNSNVLIGSFRDQKQIAVLGMSANNGNMGFSGVVEDLGSAISLNNGTSDALNASAGAGVPTVTGGGIHYADKWKEESEHVNLNYKYGQLKTHPFSSSTVEQVLLDNIYLQKTNNSSVNSQSQNSLSADIEIHPDSLSALLLLLDGSIMSGKNDFLSSNNNYLNDTIINHSTRNISSNVQNNYLRGNILWRIRAKRNKDRVFSAQLEISTQKNITAGSLYAVNTLQKTDNIQQKPDTIDQRKVHNSNATMFIGSINYTEPLSKTVILGFSYGISYIGNPSLQATYDKGIGKYDVYIDSLSSNYQNNLLAQRFTSSVTIIKGNLTSNIGGDLLSYSYFRTDNKTDNKTNQQYLEFSPRANLKYVISKYNELAFVYSGASQQPSTQQLQPLITNNDPLHIVVGNINLQPAFTHNLGLGLEKTKESQLALSFSYDFTTNPISTKTYFDSAGREISQAINSKVSDNTSTYLSLIKSILPAKLEFGANINLSYSRADNYVNNLSNRSHSLVAGSGISIGKYLPDKYSFRLTANTSWNSMHSSLYNQFKTNYFTQNHTLELSLFFFRHFEFNTSCFYAWRQKTPYFTNNNSTTVWNIHISRTFYKDILEIKCMANNILDKTDGISRSFSANINTESNYNTVGRYFLMSAAIRFVNKKKQYQ